MGVLRVEDMLCGNIQFVTIDLEKASSAGPGSIVMCSIRKVSDDIKVTATNTPKMRTPTIVRIIGLSNEACRSKARLCAVIDQALQLNIQ